MPCARCQRAQRGLDLVSHSAILPDGSLTVERLLQREDMLRPIVARQGRPQRRFRGGTAHVAVGRQDLSGSARPRRSRAGSHPGGTGDVGDRMMELQIHLHQRLLHVPNVRGRVLDETLTQPQVGAQLDHRLAGTKAAAQQPVLVQLLEPLRVIDICFPPRHLLDVAGIDQHDLEPSRLEDLEHGNPLHARGFHRDGRDADGVSQSASACKSPLKVQKSAPVRVTLGADGHDMVRRPDIDPGGVRIDRRERIQRSTLRPSHSSSDAPEAGAAHSNTFLNGIALRRHH